jgi:hypothetical protein
MISTLNIQDNIKILTKEALITAKGSRIKAARLLGITTMTLSNYVNRFDLQKYAKPPVEGRPPKPRCSCGSLNES